MAKDRREFLKKSGVLGLSGLISPFSVFSEDHDFLNRLDQSEVVLSKNDTLRCEIEETQTLAGNKLKTDAKIIEVKEHISGARQLKLF